MCPTKVSSTLSSDMNATHIAPCAKNVEDNPSVVCCDDEKSERTDTNREENLSQQNGEDEERTDLNLRDEWFNDYSHLFPPEEDFKFDVFKCRLLTDRNACVFKEDFDLSTLDGITPLDVAHFWSGRLQREKLKDEPRESSSERQKEELSESSSEKQPIRTNSRQLKREICYHSPSHSLHNEEHVSPLSSDNDNRKRPRIHNTQLNSVKKPSKTITSTSTKIIKKNSLNLITSKGTYAAIYQNSTLFYDRTPPSPFKLPQYSEQYRIDKLADNEVVLILSNLPAIEEDFLDKLLRTCGDYHGCILPNDDCNLSVPEEAKCLYKDLGAACRAIRLLNNAKMKNNVITVKLSDENDTYVKQMNAYLGELKNCTITMTKDEIIDHDQRAIKAIQSIAKENQVELSLPKYDDDLFSALNGPRCSTAEMNGFIGPSQSNEVACATQLSTSKLREAHSSYVDKIDLQPESIDLTDENNDDLDFTIIYQKPKENLAINAPSNNKRISKFILHLQNVLQHVLKILTVPSTVPIYLLNKFSERIKRNENPLEIVKEESFTTMLQELFNWLKKLSLRPGMSNPQIKGIGYASSIAYKLKSMIAISEKAKDIPNPPKITENNSMQKSTFDGIDLDQIAELTSGKNLVDIQNYVELMFKCDKREVDEDLVEKVSQTVYKKHLKMKLLPKDNHGKGFNEVLAAKGFSSALPIQPKLESEFCSNKSPQISLDNNETYFSHIEKMFKSNADNYGIPEVVPQDRLSNHHAIMPSYSSNGENDLGLHHNILQINSRHKEDMDYRPFYYPAKRSRMDSEIVVETFPPTTNDIIQISSSYADNTSLSNSHITSMRDMPQHNAKRY